MTRVLVVGDAVLDVDVVGGASRLAPDAPVPVVDVAGRHERPGGAALAATMLAADGVSTVLVAAVGDDDAGRRLAVLLRGKGVAPALLPSDHGTRVKTRVRAHGQSLVRLDEGRRCAPTTSCDTPEGMLADVDAVLVCDYAGGVVADAGVRGLLAAAVRRGLPVVWDPHVNGARPLPGVALVTPNGHEAVALSPEGPPADDMSLGAMSSRAGLLVERWSAGAVAVTLGPRGALLSYGDGPPLVVPVARRSTGDPCGAGDAFAAAAAAALASGSVVSDAVVAAVSAASRWVARDESTGGAPPSGSGTLVATGGCFDVLHAGHVRTLEAARALGDALVVLLNSDDSVRRLKGPSRPLVPAEDRAVLLRSLACVDDVVVFDEPTPARALRALRPDIWVKGGDYAGAGHDDLPEADVVAEWGGQVVLVPYLDGRSSTEVIRRAGEAVRR